MIKIGFIAILSTLLLPSKVYAFNWHKCRWSKSSTWGVLAVISSSSEFTSSTGDCAMIGMLDHDKKVYVAQNAELLQIDIARGGGEYLNNYATLAGCNKNKLSPILKSNYDQIFINNEVDPEKVYQEIERLIKENNVSGKLCAPLV